MAWAFDHHLGAALLAPPGQLAQHVQLGKLRCVAGVGQRPRPQAIAQAVRGQLDALLTNLIALIDEVERAKPATAKGKYLKSITVSSTMGPGVKIDESGVETAAKK